MKNICIIGAGEGGKYLAREVLSSRKDLNLLGFLDDDPKLQGKNVLGVKVLGKINDLGEISRKKAIEEMFIAIPSLRGKRLAKIVDLVTSTGLTFKILPGVFESVEYLSTEHVPAGTLRQVEVGDLLEREKVSINLGEISQYLKDKVVLITGAGGSIGSELARRVGEFNVKKLVLLDIYENHLYELKNELINLDYNLVIADIKDKNGLQRVFDKFKPQIIFHAAAHKHVPLMESEPREAVKNNILGSANLIEEAIRHKAEKFVFISTDKAISPSSIMGATKRFTEEHILTLPTSQTAFAIVRFGNVLGSYGSVIPLWRKQLSAGMPLTVTHPDMERYFMTIPEAAQLVIQAGAMSNGGDIFVLKMGKQYKIVDLALNFLKLSGIVPTLEKVTFTGIRPGEKMAEILSEKNEVIEKSAHPMIAKAKSLKHPGFHQISQTIARFRSSVDQLSKSDIDELLSKVISTYEPYQAQFKLEKRPTQIQFQPPFVNEEEVSAASEVIRSGWLTMGKKVLAFEEKFASLHKIENAISVNSATAGLHLSLVGLGIGPGDEVIVPSYTFVACANVITWTGAKPVFADIKKQGFVIDPEDIKRKITKKTKAILVVHFGGQMADMEEILKLAALNNLRVIEDCAHSPLASYRGQYAGTLGDAGVFSFYATKNMTTAEGGMVITSDANLADKMRILRLHGMSADAFDRYGSKGKWFYEITEAGFKYNMTDIAAAIGLVQLDKLEIMNNRRREIAMTYLDRIMGTEGIISPTVLPERKSVWHLLPILVPPDLRGNLIQFLLEYNVATSVHFIPIHLQPFYQKKFGYKKGDLPISEWVYERELSLPMHPALKSEEIDYICRVIKYFLAKENGS